MAIVVAVLLTLAAASLATPHSTHLADLTLPTGPLGLLQAAGLLFFAFAGYARIATMGEEVRDPARTIPRASIAALAIALAVFVLVGLTVVDRLGARALAQSRRPVFDAAATIDSSGLLPWAVTIAAALACLSALMNLMTGIGRTSMAMARERDVPGFLAVTHPASRYLTGPR